jgi:hypothetical protein
MDDSELLRKQTKITIVHTLLWAYLEKINERWMQTKWANPSLGGTTKNDVTL